MEPQEFACLDCYWQQSLTSVPDVCPHCGSVEGLIWYDEDGTWTYVNYPELGTHIL